MAGYRDRDAWQLGMTLSLDVYRATLAFPRHELYGMVSQMRWAAVSVPSNLAAGQARNSRGEFHQFIGHARGSLAELETQIELSGDLGYLDPNTADDLLAKAARVGQTLTGLRDWSAQSAPRIISEKP